MLTVPSNPLKAYIIMYTRKTLKMVDESIHPCLIPTWVENQVLISSHQNCILGWLIQGLSCICNYLADVKLSQNCTHLFLPFVLVKDFLEVYEITEYLFLVVSKLLIQQSKVEDCSTEFSKF